MIEKMINFAVKHLESMLKDIPNLKKEIDELKAKLVSLYKENERYKKEMENLEKEFEHNVFWELLSKSYRAQRKRIEELKKKIGINLKEREVISKAISEKQKRLDQLDSRDIKKEIADFKDKQKAVHLLIEKIPDNRKNSKFMIDAVGINIENIIYDETFNNDVFHIFLQKLKEIQMSTEQNDKGYIVAIDYAMSKIESNMHNVSDFYSIPLKYLYQAIKYTAKDGKITNNPLLMRYITMYMECDKKFDRNYGRMLEFMYDDPHSEVGIYGVKRSQNEKDLEELFKFGIKAEATDKEDGAPCIADYAKVSHVNVPTFLDILSYCEDDCQGHIILQIPTNGIKDTSNSLRTTIWGLEENDETSTDNYYFLPKYMKGFAKYHIADNENGQVTYVGREIFTNWRKYNKQLYDGSFGLGREIRILREENIEK